MLMHKKQTSYRENGMKVVVSTFNNSKNNYGALLQSCGLSAFLTKLNYEVAYVTIEQRMTKKQKRRNRLTIIKEMVKKIIFLPHARELNDRERKFKQFASETQNQILYHTDEELYRNPPKADLYLSGSDQLWNPVAMHEDLLLAYAPIGSKKISYAASMGNENIPVDNKERFIELIRDYASVSVREDTVVDVIKTITHKPVYQHVDPVFLKTQSEWIELEKPYEKLRYEQYILAYIIEWNAAYNKQLSEIKNKTGLPVVSINIGNIKKVCAEQVIYDASPNEFLYLLHNANIVVATSFHGIAMSVVYNKPFLALAGSDMPTRIQSLLRHFEIDPNSSLNYCLEDFERVNCMIIQDQIASKDFLSKFKDNNDE